MLYEVITNRGNFVPNEAAGTGFSRSQHFTLILQDLSYNAFHGVIVPAEEIIAQCLLYFFFVITSYSIHYTKLYEKNSAQGISA